MAVEFKDFSIQVKAALNDTTKAWLNTWANEIAAQAKDNTQLDGDAGIELRKSYKADVDDGAGEAKIGTPLEAGYWEEYGKLCAVVKPGKIGRVFARNMV